MKVKFLWSHTILNVVCPKCVHLTFEICNLLPLKLEVKKCTTCASHMLLIFSSPFMGVNIFALSWWCWVLGIGRYFVVLRFIKTVHQLLCYMNIFWFSNNGYRMENDTNVPTHALGCICTVHQLVGYRWNQVPADGRYSQLCDNPWMCEADK